MSFNDICERFKIIDSLNATKMAKYSLVMTPTPCTVARCLLGVCIHVLVHLLTYLYS